MKKYILEIVVENPKHDKLARDIIQAAYQIAFSFGRKKVGIFLDTKQIKHEKKKKVTKVMK